MSFELIRAVKPPTSRLAQFRGPTHYYSIEFSLKVKFEAVQKWSLKKGFYYFYLAVAAVSGNSNACMGHQNLCLLIIGWHKRVDNEEEKLMIRYIQETR